MDVQSRNGVLVVGRSDDVLSAVKAGAGSREVQAAPDVESLRWMLRAEHRGNWRVVVYELMPGIPSREAAETAELLSGVSSPVVVAPRFGLGFGVSVQRLALRRNDVMVAMDCGADLARTVYAVCHRVETLRSDTGLIVAEISPYVPSLALDCFAVTSVLGRTACKRSQLAEVVGKKLGTIEHHLRCVNALTVDRQIRWRRSLSVVFQTCELGNTEEKASVSGGWHSRTACAHAVKSCTGLTPAEWRRMGGFPAALSEYAQVWESRCAGKTFAGSPAVTAHT